MVCPPAGHAPAISNAATTGTHQDGGLIRCSFLWTGFITCAQRQEPAARTGYETASKVSAVPGLERARPGGMRLNE